MNNRQFSSFALCGSKQRGDATWPFAGSREDETPAHMLLNLPILCRTTATLPFLEKEPMTMTRHALLRHPDTSPVLSIYLQGITSLIKDKEANDSDELNWWLMMMSGFPFHFATVGSNVYGFPFCADMLLNIPSYFQISLQCTFHIGGLPPSFKLQCHLDCW